MTASETALQIPCVAGGPPHVMQVPVTHAGKTIDRLSLRVEGIDSRWAQLEPAQLVLWPGQTEEVTLTLGAPNGAPGGPHPFRVVAATAPPNQETRTVLDAVLDVAAAPVLELEVLPYRQRVRRDAWFRVRLRNFGNYEQVVRLFAGETGDTVRFTLHPDELAVGPGEEETVRLHVRPRQGTPFGRPRSVVFWAGALPYDDPLAQPLTQAAAELLITPRLGFVPPVAHYLIRIVPALIVLLIVVIVLILRFGLPELPPLQLPQIQPPALPQVPQVPQVPQLTPPAG